MTNQPRESESPPRERPLPWPSAILWLTLSLAALYLAGSGPACRLMNDGTISNRSFLSIYEPLLQATSRVPVLRRLWEAYVFLWF